MPATLNRKRPFDTVYGDDKGRKYYQGGVYFDAQGEEWEDPDAKKPLRRTTQARVQPPPTPAQPALPLEPAAPASEMADDDPAELDDGEDAGELDPAEQLARHMAGGA